MGRATGKRLSALGIHTIGQLALLPETYLVTMFGKSGSCLWRYANGLDRSPVLRADDTVPAKSVGHGTTTPADLKIEEAATLVGLCKNPALYNPIRRPERALARRNTVLGQMCKYDYITPEVRDSLEKAIARANKAVSRAESIRRYRIVNAAFTVENGYMTPSLKLKRRRVLADYADEVDALYASGEAAKNQE